MDFQSILIYGCKLLKLNIGNYGNSSNFWSNFGILNHFLETQQFKQHAFFMVNETQQFKQHAFFMVNFGNHLNLFWQL